MVHPDSIWERVVEALIIIVIFCAAIILASPLALACGVSCAVHFGMHHADWELRPSARWVIHAPFFLLLIELARAAFEIGRHAVIAGSQ
jgi:uncharacterized RDD family membrane protein YckC